jgi:twitching motility protein PilU
MSTTTIDFTSFLKLMAHQKASDLFMTVDMAGGAVQAVRIRGAAVPLSEGRIAVPQA